MKFLLLYARFAFEYALKNKTLSHIKHYNRKLKDSKSNDTPISLQLPWMTYDAIDYLSEICKPEMNIFEWGSGGSTLFFAKRCNQIISIEHDVEWKSFVEDKAKELSVTNSEVIAIEGKKIDNFASKDYRNPSHFVSHDKNSTGLSFEDYARSIEAYPKEHFDIIVIDGRVRNCCTALAIGHVKKGGYLIVDNSDRKYYLSSFPEFNDSKKWQKTEFAGPIISQYAFSKTSFFKKK